MVHLWDGMVSRALWLPLLHVAWYCVLDLPAGQLSLL